MNPDQIIPASELVLHPDGSVYHLKIKPHNLADTVILVGDPQRVKTITNFFDRVEFKSENREIHTHTGTLQNKRITVMSTGMGTDNIDIVLNELDALVNVDLENRTHKSQHSSLNIIRLGTSGGLQPDLPLNALVLSEYGLGLDGLMHFYGNSDKAFDEEITNEFIKQMDFPTELPRPYIVKASNKLLSAFGSDFEQGITATAPGFYGPQGRQVRLQAAYPAMLDRIKNFEHQGIKVLNLEMETSALFGLSKMLGHHAITLCVSIANRARQDYTRDYKKAISSLVEAALEKILTIK
jgi:uridine phosphorylase